MDQQLSATVKILSNVSAVYHCL